MSDGKSPSGTSASSASQTAAQAGPHGLLIKLLHEGRSFSGYERHHCFLNTRDGRFTDVSAVSGVDYPEDGRGVARCDWDQDGDLDLWISHRTGPQVRFLRNDGASAKRMMALRLEGTTCNHDAIGARVEVVETEAAQSPMLRTLRAGDGFLAQSSKWLHFGLSSTSGTAKAKVWWPGGEVEVFEDLVAGGRYLLTEGEGTSQPWRVKSSATPPVEPLPVERRLISVANVPLPRLEYLDDSGASREIGEFLGRPLLLNLWAGWCVPCAAELAEMTEKENLLRDAGVQVVALSVDGLADGSPTTDDAAKQLLKRLGFPFESGRASHELVSKLQLFNDVLFDSHRPLPVPTSLLIDERGWVVAIAKGPVGVSEIIQAVRALPTAAAQSDIALKRLPFDGRWVAKFQPTELDSQIIDRLLEQDLLDDAVQHVDNAADRLESYPGYGTLLIRLAVLLAENKDNARAIELFRRAAKVQPNDANTHSNLGWALVRNGLRSDAEASFQRALEINDKLALAHAGQAALLSSTDAGAAEKKYRLALEHDPQLMMAYGGLVTLYEKQLRLNDAIAILEKALKNNLEADGLHYQLGKCLRRVGRFKEAAEQFAKELQRDPNHLLALNDSARILATHPDSAVRNGERALKLARRAVAGRGAENPLSHGALAAALAEVGQYDDALVAVENAMQIAQSAQQQSLLKQLDLERQAYKSGNPARMQLSNR